MNSSRVGSPEQAAQPEVRLEDLVARSASFANVLRRIRAVAGIDALPVLLTGETGTGKSHIARLLHVSGSRARGPFVEVNCAAVPRELWEAEFFGSTKNAYTHASERAGRFAAAAGGTLFLDEIGEIPIEYQAKLLRVLDDGRYEKLGEDRTRSADVRIVAATNRDLARCVQAGTFRADLLFRIDRYRVHVPRLADRREDIEPLARQLAERECKQMELPSIPLSAALIRHLELRPWPGNIRELRSVLAQALIAAWVAQSPEVLPEHCLPEDDPSEPPPSAGGAGGDPQPPTLAAAMQDFKRSFVRSALEEESWNMARAARRLGLARSHLYNLMHDLSLARPDRGAAAKIQAA